MDSPTHVLADIAYTDKLQEWGPVLRQVWWCVLSIPSWSRGLWPHRVLSFICGYCTDVTTYHFLFPVLYTRKTGLPFTFLEYDLTVWTECWHRALLASFIRCQAIEGFMSQLPVPMHMTMNLAISDMCSDCPFLLLLIYCSEHSRGSQLHILQTLEQY